MKGAGLGLTRWSGFLTAASNVTYNAAAGKYIQTFNTAATYPILNVGSAVEFSTLDALYDECFVHYADFQAVPRNVYNTSAYCTADGDFKNGGTCGATVVGMQHNAAAYGDGVNAWINMLTQQQHAVVDLGKPWKFRWTNIEKFSWDTPLGDQTTAASTQGWCQNSLVATKYGGYLQLATPLATGAALGIGNLVEGSTPCDIAIRFRISMRARG